jgi:hypothetical protein
VENVITLRRYDFQEKRTIGELTVPGLGTFYTAEDKVRDVKVWGETAIWKGRYKLGIRKEGGMFKRWKEHAWVKAWEKKGGIFLGFIWILDVKDFTFVYFHAGNDEDDTDGCVLVGKDILKTAVGIVGVSRSREAMMELYDYLTPKIEAGEDWFIEIL